MKSSKALILRHTNGTSPGTTLEWLAKNDFEVKIIMTRSHNDWQNISTDFDLLVICGGAMNVDQEHIHPWLIEEKKFINRAVDLKKKIVGLCLGSQLLAEALGGKVEKAPHQEVGWVNMKLNTEHDWLKTSAQEMKVFSYHGYRFHTPQGAQKIAQNDFLPDQGFTFSNHVIAFQFHPESTGDWINQCVHDQDTQWPEGKPGVQKAQETLSLAPKLQPIMKAWYFSVLDHLWKS